MDEEEIKRKMLEKRMQEQMMSQHLEQKQMEETLKTVTSQILDRKAQERLSNIKLVKPELAMQLEMYLVQLYQAGQLRSLSDEQLVMILRKIGEKKDFNIRRK